MVHGTRFIIDEVNTALIKKYTLSIPNKSQSEGAADKKSNIISGFKVGRFYPLSLPTMQTRLCMFQDGRIKESFQKPEWLQERDVARA